MKTVRSTRIKTIKTPVVFPNKFKTISFSLSCLLAMSETLALDSTFKSNGIIHALQQLKNDIKELS